ncbi:MAG: anti-sigma factor antagonist BldG [Armatimonadaceae bacterium]
MDNATLEPFTITERTIRERTVALDVTGEIDIATAPKLREAIEAQASQNQERILLNLEKVDYMDSTGLSAIIKGNSAVEETNGKLVLVAPKQRITRLLQITGLEERLTVSASEEEALSL